MADRAPMTRSQIMARIRSKDTKPELALRRAMWRLGLRGWRCHVRMLPGTPDVAFTTKGLAVFVDSAFWHGYAGMPKTRRAFWRKKLRANRARDRRADRALAARGWTVLRLDADAVVRDAVGAATLVGVHLGLDRRALTGAARGATMTEVAPRR